MKNNCSIAKDDILIAIGAATAANCIPCFEHLYEKAVSAGIPDVEIRRAAEIADRVKNGAHKAISGIIDELVGSQGIGDWALEKTASESCCG